MTTGNTEIILTTLCTVRTGMRGDRHQPVSILKKAGEREGKRERKAVLILDSDMVTNVDKEPDGESIGSNNKDGHGQSSIETSEALTFIQRGPAPPGKY